VEPDVPIGLLRVHSQTSPLRTTSSTFNFSVPDERLRGKDVNYDVAGASEPMGSPE
jgi:hypothetical protein